MSHRTCLEDSRMINWLAYAQRGATQVIKLYRFPYSCYALKVQYLLDKLQLDYKPIDVPYTDRTELVKLTGGHVTVPVIEHNDHVVVESRTICQYLLNLVENELVPKDKAALIWAYADWCDSTLEDLLFRIATPGIASRFSTPFEQSLFAYIKERKFGSGCVEEWRNTQSDLIAKAGVLLEPTIEAISLNNYIAGATVSYADVTLLGHLAMVEYGDPALISEISDVLPQYMERVRAA